MRKCLLIFFLLLINYVTVAQLAIQATVVNPTCQKEHGHNFNGIDIANGIITITSTTGGTAPYTYTITGSHTTNRTQNNGYFPQLYLGSYVIAIKDAIGLELDTTFTLIATNPIPTFPKPISTPASTCNSNDGTITFKDSLGTPPFLYSIDGGATYSTSKVFNNLPQGRYVCTVQDANNCISFIWFVDVACVSTCNLSLLGGGKTACGADSDPTIFNGTVIPGSDYLAVFVSYDSILFRHPANYSFGYFNDSIANLSPGIYYIYLKDTINNNTTKYAFVIGKSCKLYINFVSIDASCGGSDGGLEVSVSNGIAPFSYTIDGIHFQSSNIITGLSTGTYTVSVIDATGEITSAIGTVYNKCPKISATRTDALCDTSTGKIFAHVVQGTAPFLFSLDKVNYQSDSVFNNLSFGWYTVYVKDVNGSMDSTVIQVYNFCLNVYNIQNTSCNLNSGSFTCFANSNKNPILYSVNNGPFTNNNFYNNLAPGIYIVVYKDSSGLTDSSHVTISNTGTAISFSLGNDTTICSNAPLVLSPKNLSEIPVSYYWSNNTTGNSIIINQSGTYWLNLTSSTGCFSSDTIKVSYLLPNKIFSTHDTASCMGNSITLDAGNTGATYLWDDNSTNEFRSVNSTNKYWVNVKTAYCTSSDTIHVLFNPLPFFYLGNDTTICNNTSLTLKASVLNDSYLWSTGTTTNSITIKQAGLYWLKATDLNNCSFTDTIKIQTKPAPLVDLGNDTTLCAGQTILLNAATPNANYLWQDGSTNATENVSNTGRYVVAVTVQGCIIRDTINVYYISKPAFTLGINQTICTGNTIVLNPQILNVNYLWQNGSITPTYTVTQPGLYYLTATNNCGSMTDSVLITKGICNFYVPNSFTPNGDGRNDIFKATFGDAVTEYHLQVYNRYGQLIFEANDKNIGWDGTFKGVKQGNGTYVWMIAYKTVTNTSLQKLNGTVLLLR